jgi:hypothetical protein
MNLGNVTQIGIWSSDIWPKEKRFSPHSGQKEPNRAISRGLARSGPRGVYLCLVGSRCRSDAIGRWVEAQGLIKSFLPSRLDEIMGHLHQPPSLSPIFNTHKPADIVWTPNPSDRRRQYWILHTSKYIQPPTWIRFRSEHGSHFHDK